MLSFLDFQVVFSGKTWTFLEEDLVGLQERKRSFSNGMSDKIDL